MNRSLNVMAVDQASVRTSAGESTYSVAADLWTLRVTSVKEAVAKVAAVPGTPATPGDPNATPPRAATPATAGTPEVPGKPKRVAGEEVWNKSDTGEWFTRPDGRVLDGEKQYAILPPGFVVPAGETAPGYGYGYGYGQTKPKYGVILVRRCRTDPQQFEAVAAGSGTPGAVPSDYFYARVIKPPPLDPFSGEPPDPEERGEYSIEEVRLVGTTEDDGSKSESWQATGSRHIRRAHRAPSTGGDADPDEQGFEPPKIPFGQVVVAREAPQDKGQYEITPWGGQRYYTTAELQDVTLVCTSRNRARLVKHYRVVRHYGRDNVGGCGSEGEGENLGGKP